MRSLVLITAALFLGSSTARAEEVPYGPAGCGLGSMIIGNDPGIMQIFAMTTNGISANQLFGITTGTLGCDVGGDGKTAKVFVEGNREAVAKDISRGSGESIATLSRIGGCSSDVALGAYLQQNFEVIFPGAHVSDAAVADGVVDLMRAPGAPACVNLQTGA
jgi:hypothetical protein